MRILFLLPLFFTILPTSYTWGGPCDSVLVTANATGGTLTCAQPYVTVLGTGSPAPVSYQWSGPDGFSAVTNAFVVTISGNYTVTVTTIEGCTATATAVVTNNCTAPWSLLEPSACEENGAIMPAESCPTACVFRCMGDTYPGSTSSYRGDSPPPGFCSQIQNDQWIAFMATRTNVSLKATPSNCTTGQGIQMAIYPSCNEQPLDCDAGCESCGETPVYAEADNLVLGKVYYILIDGFSGDQCDFILEDVGQTLCDTVFAPCDTPILTGPTQVCPGGTYDYHFDIDTSCIVTGFLWTGPPGTLINGVPVPAVFYNPEGRKVSITYGPNAFSNIPVCVRPVTYFSAPSFPYCLNVSSIKIPTTILPPVTVCNEDLPYQLPWGDEVFGPGTYSYTYISVAGCDSVVSISVSVKAPINVNLGNRFLCFGETITICGDEISEPGAYLGTCESYQGCDSLVFVQVWVMHPVAEILSNNTELNCNNSSLILTSTASPSTPAASVKQWKKLPSTVAGFGNNLTVTSPGTYVLTTTQTAGGRTCIATDTIVITAAGDIMNASISGNPISCSQPLANMQVTVTNVVEPLFVWSGPPGVALLPAATQVVSVPGTYTVTVTNPDNGCTATATYVITGNANPPNLTLSSPAPNCGDTLLFVVAGSTTAGAVFNWSGPGSFTAAVANPTVPVAGIYTVTVTSPAGCTASGTVEAVPPPAIPFLQVTGVHLTCDTPVGQVSVVANLPGTTFVWTGPGGFTAIDSVAAVTLPGDYMVTATTPDNCTATATVAVTAAQQIPVLVTTGFQINCIHTTPGSVSVTSSIAGSAFEWTGPGGFFSTDSMPTVTLPGDYTVVATAPDGCTAAGMATVSVDTDVPVITVSGDGVLDCNHPQIILTVSVLPANAGIEWSGPGVSGTSNPEITVTLPGEYTLTATALNGCTSTAVVSVLQDITPVSLTVSQTLPGCGDSLLYLTAFAGGNMILWSGPGGFTSSDSIITVGQSGIYSVTATGPNGCTATAQITAVAPPAIPVLNVVGDSITCADPVAQLSVISNIPGTTFLWSGPFGFSSALSDPVADSTGVYQVTASSPDGCTNAGIAVVTGGCTTVGVVATEMSGIRIFPVPSRGLIYTAFDGKWLGRDLRFQLFDATGKLIRMIEKSVSNGSVMLDFQDISAGNYHLVISGGGEMVRFAVVLVK